MVVCDRPALGLVAGAGGDCDADVGGGTAEDLEQHPHRDEPRAAPATAAKGAHGCAVQPDQSALFVQHTEHGFCADSIRSGYGARGGAAAEQYFAKAAAQTRNLCALEGRAA